MQLYSITKNTGNQCGWTKDNIGNIWNRFYTDMVRYDTILTVDINRII